jgi:hypothetical protein
MPELAIVIKVLHVGVDHVGRRQTVAGLERSIDGPARLQVPDADAVECLSLARFDEFILDDDAGVPVQDDLEPGTKFAGAVVGHSSIRAAA